MKFTMRDKITQALMRSSNILNQENKVFCLDSYPWQNWVVLRDKQPKIWANKGLTWIIGLLFIVVPFYPWSCPMSVWLWASCEPYHFLVWSREVLRQWYSPHFYSQWISQRLLLSYKRFLGRASKICWRDPPVIKLKNV